jgi:CheY-like chemotaxis protein
MRALIVDDSAAARLQARVALEGAAEALPATFVIEEAGSGAEALRLLAREPASLLIVDLHMPDIHGLDVLGFWHRQRATGPRAAVVVSSAVSSRDVEKARALGATSILEKPVAADAFLPVLRALHGSGD